MLKNIEGMAIHGYMARFTKLQAELEQRLAPKEVGVPFRLRRTPFLLAKPLLYSPTSCVSAPALHRPRRSSTPARCSARLTRPTLKSGSWTTKTTLFASR